MKKFVLDFLHRGLVAAGFGPIVLVIVYLVLRHAAAIETLTVSQVCIGIISLTVLAFLAGGMNSIYQIEQLSLMAAIGIHGCVLYVGYLGTYLVNDWLAWGTIPVVVFSAAFAVGYLVIWGIIYAIIQRRTAKLNQQLRQKQQASSANGQ